MMNKKYQLLLDDTIVREGRKLYRIQALRDLTEEVKAKMLGGYLESEANLSHEGDCWIYRNACAYEDARVEGDALLSGWSTLRGKAKLIEGARIFGHAIVQGEATVGGESRILDQVVVGGSAILKGNIFLYEKVHIGGNAYLEGTNPRELILQGTTMIHGDTIMQGYGRFPERDAIFETGSFLIEEEKDDEDD